MRTLKVIIPLPSRDFDPTEAAVSWKILRDAGHDVRFATPDGKRAYADPRMLTGEGLDFWGWVPGLNKIRVVGLLLRADSHARRAYAEMQRDRHFLDPLPYQKLATADYDGLLLPGGHAPGMKQYLEDKTLQEFVAAFFDTPGASGRHKPVAAICHGVVLAARSVSRRTGRSVLHGRRSTALTWQLERSAWLLSRYLARYWDAGYYRTYLEKAGEPCGYRSVEMEVRRVLASDADFIDVPKNCADRFRKTSGIARDRLHDARPAWVVQDGTYVSARWPGDAHTFARRFAQLLEQYRS